MIIKEVLNLNYYVLVLVFCLPGLSGFAQLTASFEVSLASGCVPLEVEITNTSTNTSGATYSWDAGNGKSSTSNNPTFTYTNAGTYTLTLVATSGNQSSTTSLEIVAFANPIIKAELDTNLGCTGLEVTFTGSVITSDAPIASWEWDYGDAFGESTADSVTTHSYTFVGEFGTSVFSLDTNGCKSAVFEPDSTIKTSAAPSVTLSSDKTLNACTPPLEVDLWATVSGSTPTPLTYEWTIDGDYTTNQDSAHAIFDTLGMFPINVVVTNAYGCQQTVSKTAVISEPISSFIIDPDTLCLGSSIIPTNSSIGGSSSWYFDTTDFSVRTLGTNPTFTYSDSGSYTVALVIAGPGNCKDTSYQNLYIQQTVANYTVDANYSCNAFANFEFQDSSTNATSWNWQIHEMGTADSVSFSIAQNATASILMGDVLDKKFITWLDVSSDFGCVDTVALDTLTISRIRLSANSTDTAGTVYNAGCPPLTFDLNATAASGQDATDIISYTWQLSDGSEIDGSTVRTEWESTGYFPNFVTAQNELGCTESTIVEIYVGDTVETKFDLDFGQNDSACSLSPVIFREFSTTDQFANNRVTQWEWLDFGDGGSLKYDITNVPPSIQHNYADTGWMNVTLVADYFGCPDTVTIDSLVFIQGPIAKGKSSAQVCTSPNDRTFTAQFLAANRLEWDFDTDGTIDSITSIDNVHSLLIDTVFWTFPTTGNFTTTVTAYNDSTGCEWAETIDVNIYNIAANFTIIDDNVLCLSDSLAVSVSGGDQAQVKWDYDNDDIIDTAFAVGDIDILYIKFDGPGRHRTRLFSQDPNGCSDTTAAIANVYSPRVGFTTDTLQGCIPFEINLLDTTNEALDTTFVNRIWNYGYGDPEPVTTADHQHTFDGILDPNLELSLISFNALGCSDTAFKTVLVSSPDSNFTISTLTTCVNQAVTFTPADTNGVNYAWIFGDGSDTVKTKIATHAFADSSSNQSAQLIWTDSLGCTVQRTRNDLSIDRFPEAGFSDNRANFPQLCSPWQAQFIDTSIGAKNIAWNLAKSSLTYIPNNPAPTATYSNGTFEIELIAVSSNNCSTTVAKTYIVEGPVARLSLSPSTICRGEVVNFTLTDTSDVGGVTWDFGDGELDQLFALDNQHQYNSMPLGSYFPVDVILLAADTGSTCNTTVSDSVFVHDARAVIELDSTRACSKDQFTFNNLSVNADQWVWNFGDGSAEITDQYSGLTHVYERPGTFELSLAIQQLAAPFCVDTAVIELDILPLPPVEVVVSCLSRDTALITMTDTGNVATYHWPAVNWIMDNGNNSFMAYPENTETVLFTAISNDNCRDSTEVEVYIKPVLEKITSNDTIGLIIGEYVDLEVFEDERDLPTTYEWSPNNDWINCITCNPTEIQPLETITYQVIATNDCFVDTAFVTVGVLPELSLDVPQAFTPNGDGVNDTIYAAGWGIKELIAFQIYNRWGEMVYENPGDLKHGWDGYYKGQLQNIETYSYVVIAEGYVTDSSGNPEQINKQGHISLFK